MNVLKNKNILLCVTGSIAAYKACEILRLLRKDGANVQVMMSKSAEEFIGVATFAALSNNEVLTNLFPDNPKGGMDHVNLSFELDAIIVAPATANILCKAATGVADEIVSTMLSIASVPILFAPAEIISKQSLSVEIPPEALICRSPETDLILFMSFIVAP